MKKDIFKLGRWASCFGVALLLSVPVSFTSCKEDISEDAYAVKKMPSMADCISEDPELSDIKALFEEVRLGRSDNASVLLSVLSARGNYTVFAPTNSAIRNYVRQLTNGADSMAVALDQEHKDLVALNCIIDNGTNNAYERADFRDDGSTFPTSNLKDRKLSCELDSTGVYHVINGDARVIESNIEVSNGMLHKVDHVIAPSTDNVAELIQQAANMRIMGKLLELTGWADSLALQTKAEVDYENAHIANAGSTKRFASHNFAYQTKRSIGFTAFIETDSVFNIDWNVEKPQYDAATGQITNWDAILGQIERKCETLMKNTEAKGDYKNPNNVVNQFVAYHLLDGAMASDEFVHHFNEYNYDYGADARNPLKSGYSVNVWDYFTTKGNPRSLLKITQIPGGDNDFYLNRISEYNNGFKDDYSEKSFLPYSEGRALNIKVDLLNRGYENNALNGFYFPIDHVLVNTPETRSALASTRIRVDIVTMLPEILSNDMRGRSAFYLPVGYFGNITKESQGTEFYYLQDGYVAHNSQWKDYQGDEILVSGRYDFVLKLPPVPEDGTYELRMGTSLNELRSMVQVYIGESPDLTKPIGLPIDQRESVEMIPGKPWKADTGDEATDRENDRNLRNQGYMKAPNYIGVTGHKGAVGANDLARNADPATPALRRILTTQEFKRDKTYYLRFKCAIENDKTQFMLDYFEFVPTKIANGLEKPEDIW